jgi:hypothetical protein
MRSCSGRFDLTERVLWCLSVRRRTMSSNGMGEECGVGEMVVRES